MKSCISKISVFFGITLGSLAFLLAASGRAHAQNSPVNGAGSFLTETTLTINPNPAVVGAIVTTTATVRSPSGIPTGTVTFLVSGTELATLPLQNGKASIDGVPIAPAIVEYVVRYDGHENFLPSTSTMQTLTVGRASTATAVTSSNTTPNLGERIALTARVSVLPPANGAPEGSVEFFDGPVSIGTAALVTDFSTWTVSATLHTSALSSGVHVITATYGGDVNRLGSTSPWMALTVIADADNDGRPDHLDNCPDVVNNGQENFDGDALGDACDADDDNDGLADAAEVIAGTNAFDRDSDDDNIVDGLDRAPLSPANNVCLGLGADAALSLGVSTQLTCAVTGSIKVQVGTRVAAGGGDLLLIAPTVAFEGTSLFRVERGSALRVVSRDPTASIVN